MNSEAESRTPLTPAVFHVLLSLADGPLHGYAIMKQTEKESGIPMGPGTIYGSLRRLTDVGWVEEMDHSADGGDPRRGKSFRLTPSGRGCLAAEARRITHLAGLEHVRKLATGGNLS